MPRETLVGYCDAAWQVARKADPGARNLQDSFDRALLMIAWTQRRSGGRLPLSQLVDETIPRVALEPFVAARALPAEAEDLEQTREQARAAKPKRAPAWRSLPRVPFSSPIPVGATVAAGVVGVAIMGETRVIPIAPLEPTGGDDVADRGAAGESREEAGPGAGPADAPASTGPGPIGNGWQSADLSAGAAQVSAEPDPAPSAEASGAADPAPSPRTAAAEDLASTAPPAELVAAVARAPAPAVPVPALPAPSPPVVRIELPPPKMLVEVSAPAPVEIGEGEAGRPVPEEEPGAPGDDRSDEPDERDEGGDPVTDKAESEPREDDEEVGLDGLTDSRPDLGDTEDGDDPEPPAAESPAAPSPDDLSGPVEQPSSAEPAEPPAVEVPAATPAPPTPPA